MLLCTNISCKNVKIYIYMFNIQRNLIIIPILSRTQLRPWFRAPRQTMPKSADSDIIVFLKGLKIS